LTTPIYLGVPALIWALLRPEHIQLWLIAALAAAHVLAMRSILRRVFAVTFDKAPSLFNFLAGGLLATFVMIRAYWVVTGRGCVQWGKTSYRVRGSQIVDALPEVVASNQ
ncbi:MAG: hypothetical protein ACE5EQ_11620, partial [Phycisphaerae bacterium]